MRVKVAHHIDDLAADLIAIPGRFAREAPRIVERNANEGNRLARNFAREKSGPHGSNYYKRLTAEMTGDLTAEYGPAGIPKSNFIGAGFRNGGTNMDLPNSADLIGPKFAKDVGDMADGFFW